MRQNGIAKLLIRKFSQDRGLHRSHDLSRLSADHREAENAIIILSDNCLHEALRFVRRLRAQDRAHRQLRNTHRDAVALRLAFAQSHVGKLRVREHAVGHEPIARAAVSPSQVVPDDAKVIAGHMRELRAAGAVPHGPHVGRRGLQPVVDANISARVQRDAGLLSPMSCVFGTRPAATRMSLPSISCSPDGVRTVTRTPSPERPWTLRASAADRNWMPSSAEDPLHLSRNVRIFPAHQLRPRLDDGHAAAEPTISLRQFEADIAGPEHDQMRRQVIELESLDMGERPGSLETGNGGNCRMRSDVDENASPASTRVPPSLRCTSSVFGATKRPLPMINSAPVVL